MKDDLESRTLPAGSIVIYNGIPITLMNAAAFGASAQNWRLINEHQSPWYRIDGNPQGARI
jgi:hypothetical protein